MPMMHLSPTLIKATMEIHHGKHHAAYVTNLNKSLETTEWKSKSLEEILANMSKLPIAVRNNGGGHWNHSAFWNWMKPKVAGTSPTGKLGDAIKEDFGSFDKFKEQFSNAAVARFGSGWAWLIQQDGKLVIASTPNRGQSADGHRRNKRHPGPRPGCVGACVLSQVSEQKGDHIAAFWNVVNWDEVARRYAAVK